MCCDRRLIDDEGQVIRPTRLHPIGFTTFNLPRGGWGDHMPVRRPERPFTLAALAPTTSARGSPRSWRGHACECRAALSGTAAGLPRSIKLSMRPGIRNGIASSDAGRPARVRRNRRRRSAQIVADARRGRWRMIATIRGGLSPGASSPSAHRTAVWLGCHRRIPPQLARSAVSRETRRVGRSGRRGDRLTSRAESSSGRRARPWHSHLSPSGTVTGHAVGSSRRTAHRRQRAVSRETASRR